MKIALIDPLSLIGKEISRLLPAWPGLERATVDCFHTAGEEEHEIAELGGEPVLVQPLEPSMDLSTYDALLIASAPASEEASSTLVYVAGRLSREVALVDAVGVPALRPLTEVATAARMPRSDRLRHYRVPPPPVTAALHLFDAVAGLDPVALSIHAEEPVSVLGPAGIEALVAQASARLQGEPVTEDVLGDVRAFNLTTVPEGGWNEDARTLLAPLQVVLSRSATGRFHAHVAHLTLLLAAPAGAQRFEEACRRSERLKLVERLDLSTVPDATSVHVGPVVSSQDGRMISLTAAVDGLLLGGAWTALEMLVSLV